MSLWHDTDNRVVYTTYNALDIKDVVRRTIKCNG